MARGRKGQPLLFFFILYLFLFLWSCEKKQKPAYTPENQRVDSLCTSLMQLAVEEPCQTKKLITYELKNIRDSINYYRMLFLLSRCYEYENKPDSAYLIYDTILRFCQRKGNPNPEIARLEIICCNNASQNRYNSGHTDRAIDYLRQAIDVAYQPDAKECRQYLPQLYLLLAEDYHFKSDYPSAVDNCRKAMLAADSIDQTDQYHLSVYGTLARIYLDLKNFPLADHYYELAEKSLDQLSLADRYVFANARGYYYYTTKEYEKALPWYQQSYSYARQLKMEHTEAPLLANLGEIYLCLGKTDSSQYYLDKAAGYYFRPDNTDTNSRYYMNMLYLSLYLEKGDMKEAECILNQSYPQDNFNYIYTNGKRLEEFYTRKGDYKKAYELRKQIDSLDDSLRTITIQNNIAEIDSRYRQDTTVLKRDIFITQQDRKVQQFRNTTIILILVLIVIVVTVATIMVCARRKKEKEYARQVSIITKLRMENVRNRISPHFILNVLNSLIPGLEGHKELNLPLNLLTQSIRECLLVSEKIAIPLKDEINIVSNYAGLRKSINPRIPEIQWDITPETDMTILLPSMIIQIPVENAINHAFRTEQQDKQLSITIRKENHLVSIAIEDNGMGVLSSRNRIDNPNSTGQGLRILFKTIELLNSKNQNKIRLDIQDLGKTSPGMQGTRVNIEIPTDFQYD